MSSGHPVLPGHRKSLEPLPAGASAHVLAGDLDHQAPHLHPKFSHPLLIVPLQLPWEVMEQLVETLPNASNLHALRVS